jgi:serine/threonine protein kinase
MNPVVITLTDFGLARKDVCPTKRMNTFCGSLDFLAPEVVKMSPFLKSRTKKQGYGKEVDIWAIGVIAYSIMSGEFPFVDERPMQLLQSIVNDGVFFSSAWITKSKLGAPPPWANRS